MVPAMSDPWIGWLQRMLLRETQVRGALAAHARRIRGPLRAHYDALVKAADTRVPALRTALAVRGESPSRAWLAFVRGVGTVTGTLTSLGGEKRILAMDLDGVRRLERDYFEASSRKPPVDISCTLCAFVASIEADRSRLVDEVKALFV